MAQTTFSGPVASQNGFLLPSFTNEEIIAIQNPATGLMVFNTTTAETAYYNGTEWVGATPPVVSVTYTRGVDWIDGSSAVLYSGMTGTIQSAGAPWANSAAEAIFTSQPSGTVYTVVATDTTTGTMTTTSAWSGGGGLMSATANASGTFAPGFNYTLISVTFTPA